MKRLIPLCLIMAGFANAADPEGSLSPQEQQCKQRIEAYYALDRAKQRKEIQGVSLIGLQRNQLENRIGLKGYCASWQELVKKLMKQHPEILDATEEMTGKPSPIR